MNSDYINLLETTPKLKSKKCKTLSFIVKTLLQYTTFIAALFAWYLYDYFIAGATLLLAFIIIGIIRSKIRNSVIPFNQQEYQYTDQGIADWFIAKQVCQEEEFDEE